MEKGPKLRKIRLKCRFEGETRTVTVTPTTEFAELRKRLSSDYGFDVSMKYEDKDGDMIILASQNDLDDIFMFDEAETINVVISETLSLPNLHLKGNMSSSRLGTPANLVVSLYNTSSVFSSAVQANPTNLASGSQIWSRPTNNSELSSVATNNTENNLSVQSGILNRTTQNVNPNNSTNTNAASVASRSLRPVNGSRLERFPNIGDNNQQTRQQEMFNIRWKKGEMLGQGAFGVVYLGLNIDTGELMAVKQMATEDVSRRELSSLENEIHLLRNLRHPNIVRYIGTELNPESMSIFLEYVPGGSLKALIDKFGSLEESVARSYTRQLLIGLEYLHRHGIAHRDIKGANCLVGNDGVIKLADFGNSKHWRPITATDTNGGNNSAVHASTGDIKGTPSWMAPEVIRDEGGSISWRKADIWSLACTTLEMTTGKAPWKQFNNPVTILYHIACQDTLPEYPSPASFELITFLNTCLQRDPKLRPDITSLLLHPFVAHTILPPNMNSNNSTNWSSTNNNANNSSGFNNSTTSGSAYNSMYNNRPSTVSHAVVGEWDRSLPQSLFYAVSRNTNNSVTPSVNTRVSPDTAQIENSDFAVVNNDTSILLRAEDPELALEVNHDTHIMPINAAAGYADTTSNTATPMFMLPSSATHNDTEPNVANTASVYSNSTAAPSPSPSVQSTPTTTYPKNAYPSRLVALNHTAGSSPSTARTHKRRVKNITTTTTNTTTNNTNNTNAMNSPSSRGSSAVKHTTLATSDSVKRSAKKGISSPVQQPRRNFRDLDSPLTVNHDTTHIVDTTDPVDSMHAIGMMEAQLAQLLQQSTEPNAKLSAHAPSMPVYTTTTPIKNAFSTDSVNEDDVVTPPNHNLFSHRVVPKLDIYSQDSHHMPLSGEKADGITSGNKKSAMKAKRHSRNRPAFESFDSADHHAAWAGDSQNNNNISIEGTMNTIYNNVSFDNSIAMDNTSRTIHFDTHTIDANHLDTSRNLDSSRNCDTSLNMDNSVGHDNDSLTGVGDEDTLCSNEPMLGYSSTEEYNNNSARSGFGHNYYNNSHHSVPRHKSKKNAAAQREELLPTNEPNYNTLSNAPNITTTTTNTNTNTRGVMKSGKSTSGSGSISKSQNRLNASKSQTELAEELSIVANNFHASGKSSGTSVIPPTSLQTPSTGIRKGGINDSIDTSLQEGLSIYNSLPNSTNTVPSGLSITTNTLRHSSSRKGLESAASRQGTRHSTAKTATRLNRSDSHSNPDSMQLDPLDISCDSLDKLHITGTAAASKSDGISTKYADREGTAKHLNTRQSKRGSTANNNIQAAAPAAMNAVSNYLDDPRFERIEPNTDIDYPIVPRLFDAPPTILHEHSAAITRLRAPTRTNLLYSSSLDGTVRIWNNNDPSAGSCTVLEATGFKCENVYGERTERRIVLSSTTNASNTSGAGDNEVSNLGSSSARTATVRVNNLWVDENGESIYAACSDAAVRVWNGTEGKPLRLLRGHEDQITVLEGMDNGGNNSNSVGTNMGGGSLIATGSADRTVRVWDVRVKKAQLFAFRGHGDTVLALRWGEGGRSLVSSGKDKTVRIWDTRAGRLRVTLEKHFGSVSCLRIVNNATSTMNTTHTDTINNNNNNTLSTADATCIVSAGRDSMMNIWSPSGDCIHSQTAHRGTVSFLSEINYITNSYSAAYQNNAHTAFNTNINSKATYYAPFSAHPLMISLGTDSLIKLWDMRRFKCIHEINPTLSGAQTGLFTKAVWSEMGFIVASNNGLVRLYEHNSTDTSSLSGKGAYRSELNNSLDRSESHSPGPMPYPAAVPSTANNSQEWTYRDLAVHSTNSTNAGGAQVNNNSFSGVAGASATATSTLNAVTDLLCTENMCVSGAKSGQLLRWLKGT